MKQILALFIISGLMAQKHDWDDYWDKKEHEDRDHERSERMESMMVWRLTEALELSPEQAEKFFPRFRKHRGEMDDIRKQERAIGDEVADNIHQETDMSKDDVKKHIEKVSELRKKRIELETEYLLGMDDVLTPRQLARLGVFKERMMQDMRGELKERKGKKGKSKHKKKRKRGNRRRGY